jgi:hypothetical protein
LVGTATNRSEIAAIDKVKMKSGFAIFAEYNQDATFYNLFISVRRSTCFRRVFRPSSGAKICAYSARYLSDLYCYLLLAGQAIYPESQLELSERNFLFFSVK